MRLDSIKYSQFIFSNSRLSVAYISFMNIAISSVVLSFTKEKKKKCSVVAMGVKELIVSSGK